MYSGIFKFFQKPYFPQSLKGKIMLVSFVGIHIPLLVMIIYYVRISGGIWNNIDILIIALAGTLLSVAGTLWILSALLNPIHKTIDAIQQYLDDQTPPSLPTKYNGDTGQLMASSQMLVERLDGLLNIKNDWISMISHDARSPLTSILLAQEMIVDDLEDSDAYDDDIAFNLDIIEQNARQQEKMFDNLLTSTKIESNEYDLVFEQLSIPTLITNVINTFQLKADAQKTLIKKNHLDGDVTLRGDQSKISSILHNLVANALEFTSQGDKIIISASEDGDHALISVKDTGFGIDQEKKEKIFKRGYTKNAPGSTTKGSGLGLWICKEFVGMHKGDITVESTPGEGTEFSVQIPKK